jgi:RNA polymerase sigma-70 factor (ECF subfamily)
MATESDDDISLTRRIAAAVDHAAESEFYRRFLPRLRAYGRRHLGDASSAEDLAQDVLLTVITNLREGRVRQPERIHGYVLSICRLCVADRLRGERRRRALLEQAAPWLTARTGSQRPAADVDADELARCLERLAPRERSAVIATFFAAEPPQSIAASLGTSLENVRVIRHRALRALHACLTEAG